MLFSKIDKEFLKLSVTDEIVDLGSHSVITGYLRAYQNHYPITISPDIAWLLICQGFSNHINNSPEELKSKFVSFDGKQMLTVIRDQNQASDLATFPWETLFPEFTEQIAKFTGKSLIDNLTADFTTTTPTATIASQITIMESMKEFFNYKVTFIGCGLPEVTIEGSVKDWEKIDRRLDYLTKFDLKWWTSELKPIIKKIIETKKGKLDQQFWMNMVKYHKLGAYGAYNGIDGWLLKFYPYLTGGSPPMLAQRKDDKNEKVDFPMFRFDDPAFKTRKLYLRRSEFKEINNIDDLPKEVANVPFEFEIQDNSGKVIKLINMEFWAGFMGVRQDKTTFNVKPEIGWAINKLKNQ
ncbi:MAG: DUF4419 domain-containing protein [Sphingobacteriales bacterium]|nr:MAG: DUF4419 domain-containing protein [Sphingobacteriales bacterium]